MGVRCHWCDVLDKFPTKSDLHVWQLSWDGWWMVVGPLMDWQTKHVVDVHSYSVVEPSQSSHKIYLFIYLFIFFFQLHSISFPKVHRKILALFVHNENHIFHEETTANWMEMVQSIVVYSEYKALSMSILECPVDKRHWLISSSGCWWIGMSIHQPSINHQWMVAGFSIPLCDRSWTNCGCEGWKLPH